MTSERAVRDILNHPLDREWSIQGFGMLRTYLDDERIERLHIWDANLAVPEVSTIHDHPWDFTSRIIFGDMTNQRYQLIVPQIEREPSEYRAAQIVCGVGGGLLSDPFGVIVQPAESEHIQQGDEYSQLAPEFHESFPVTGTVSIIRRSFHEDRDIATVAWKTGDWVSAEPRPATREEILHFVKLAKELQ